MDAAKADDLVRLLGYDEHEAGGFMTTAFLVAHTTETVGSLSAHLAGHEDCPDELDAVALVDDNGRMVWDLPLLQLLVNADQTVLGDGRGSRACHCRHPRRGRRSRRAPDRGPTDVGRGGRRSRHPGRSDPGRRCIDALMPERGRIHFPRLLQ